MQFSEHMNQIYKFMKKHDFPVELDLKKEPTTQDEVEMMNDVATSLFLAAKSLEVYMESTTVKHQGIPRLQLIVEELAEVAEALITNDEVALLDGLSDLLYVTLGTAITYNSPIEEGHLEICRSNLTKAVRKPEDDPRLRDKGPDYHPPRLKEILYGCAVCKYHSTENKAVCKQCENKGKTNE